MNATRPPGRQSRQFSLRFLLTFTCVGGAFLGLVLKWATAPPPLPDRAGWFELPWIIRTGLGATTYDALTMGLAVLGLFTYLILCVCVVGQVPRLITASLFVFLCPTALLALFSTRDLYGAGEPTVGLLIGLAVATIVEAVFRGLWAHQWATVVCAVTTATAVWLFILAIAASV